MHYTIHIIDDEHSGRIALKILLEKVFSSSIESMIFSNSFEEARQMLGEESSDIVFLDINLNGHSAFELVSLIPSTSKIIFVTAYSDYMLNAIRIKAFDYLVKPIREDDLNDCLKRLQSESPNGAKRSFIAARYNGAVVKIPVGEILYAEGSGPYCIVHTSDRTYMVSKTLKKISLQLDDKFARIHKGYLVNTRFIKRTTRTNLILTNNKTLPISRSGLKNIASFYLV